MTKDVAYYKSLPYHIILYQDTDDDGVYWAAEVREWPGCAASGRLKTEALEHLNIAIKNWLESSIEHGDAITEPTEPLSPTQFFLAMKRIVQDGYDEEPAHRRTAVDLMCAQLRMLGYGDGVAVFESARKWYA